MDFFERYEDRIEPEPNTGCWLWTGKRHRNGHGEAPSGRRARRVYAHRLAYAAAHPDEPLDGVLVRHRCDNRPCVNPAHLILGTHEDNMRDMAGRRRAYAGRGEHNPQARLTDSQVEQIRLLHGQVSLSDLARRFGVSVTQVWRIVHGINRRTNPEKTLSV